MSVRRALAAALCAIALGACSSSGGAHHAATGGPRLHGPLGQPDHFHAALGVNICGKWQPGPIWEQSTEFGSPGRHDAPQLYAGLHTHQLSDGSSDAIIHEEPASPDEAGTNATLGKYMEFGGWKLTATSMRLWPGLGDRPVDVRNGKQCGEEAVVRWAVGRAVRGHATRLVEQHGDPSKLQLTDSQVIALYFVSPSIALSTLGDVPSVANLPGRAAPLSQPTTTTVPRI